MLILYGAFYKYVIYSKYAPIYRSKSTWIQYYYNRTKNKGDNYSPYIVLSMIRKYNTRVSI